MALYLSDAMRMIESPMRDERNTIIRYAIQKYLSTGLWIPYSVQLVEETMIEIFNKTREHTCKSGTETIWKEVYQWITAVIPGIKYYQPNTRNRVILNCRGSVA
jgi:hypothetical protein